MKNLRTCQYWHQYYKSSNCPICPVCEELKKPEKGLLSSLGAPARRALLNVWITNVSQLSKYSEKEILELHGMGPGSLPKLRKALTEAWLNFIS